MKAKTRAKHKPHIVMLFLITMERKGCHYFYYFTRETLELRRN